MLTAAEEGSANFPDNSHNSFDVAGRNKNSGECPSHSPISSRLSQIVDGSRPTTAAINSTPNSAVSKPSPGQTAHAWTLLGSEVSALLRSYFSLPLPLQMQIFG